MKIWHLSIDYDEDIPGSYRAVCVKGEGGEKRFDGRGPQEDWAAYMDWAKASGAFILETSSIMHFCWDNPEWRFIEDAEGRETLVPEDRPEWLNEI